MNNDFIYVSLLEMGKERLVEAETLQRRRLPKPDGKDKKLSFKNHTNSLIIVRAVGYFEESDSDYIFNYTELNHSLEPNTTLVVNVHADLIETLYKLKNGN